MTQFFDTTQGVMTIGALIGAGSFVAGAVGAVLMRWLMSDRRPGSVKAEARDLAMRTVLALDDFVGAAYTAVHDTPEFNPMDDSEFAFHTPDPALTLPADGDWTLLGADFGDEVMWLSNRIKNQANALDSLDLSSPGYDGFFERRQEGYARLAATAMDLIERLLGRFELTLPDKPDYYRQREGFVKILKGAGEDKPHAAKAFGPAQADVSNVTPLFPGKV